MSEEQAKAPVEPTHLSLDKADFVDEHGGVAFHLTNAHNHELIFKTKVGYIESYYFQYTGKGNPVYLIHFKNGKSLVFTAPKEFDETLGSKFYS